MCVLIYTGDFFLVVRVKTQKRKHDLDIECNIYKMKIGTNVTLSF